MKRFSEDSRRKMISGRFCVWRDFLRDLEMTAEDHSVVRFPNSASYIFSTGKTFWLVDPSFNYFDCGENDPELDEVARLINEKISFVLVTHLHPDHCQTGLVKKITEPSITWVVSERFSGEFHARYGVGTERTIILKDGEETVLHGIRITAQRGYHNEPGRADCPSCSYNILLPDGVKIFMPSDVRDFNAEIPDMSETDYTFGHIFLGREDAEGDSFSKLDGFCRFFSRRKSGKIILAHLYELGRLPRDLWTHRHAELVRNRLKKKLPDVKIYDPYFGESLHLSKGPEKYPDLFARWSPEARNLFLDHLGISIRKNHEQCMELAISEKIPVLEWNSAAVREIPAEKRMEQLDRWRGNGGRILSMHLPNMFFDDDPAMEKLFSEALNTVLDSGMQRVTIHVPGVSLQTMKNSFERIALRYAEKLRILIEHGIAVGIENLHMKPDCRADETRPFGFIPEECIAFTEKMRALTNSDLWGCHLDIGHAYSNAPYSGLYDTALWLKMCGPLLNGLHLHQFESSVSEEKPYLKGHFHITSRNTGHPNLFPVYEAWEKGIFRAPMILEAHNTPEIFPVASLLRLKKTKEF